MTELSLNNTAVIPFTVDHLGGLGTFAHSLLFGKRHHPSTPTPPLPLPPLQFDHPQIQAAYNRSSSLDIAFLLSANTSWSNINRNLSRNTRFGTTYRTATPLQWALQNLALNFSFALANHFNRALNRLSNRSSVSATLSDPQHLPRYSSQRAPTSPDHTAPAGHITRIIPGRAL